MNLTIQSFMGIVITLMTFILQDSLAQETVAKTATASETAKSAESPHPSQKELHSLAISSLEDVRKAVVFITARGNFNDLPDKEMENPQGDSIQSGSGFIIDPSGIAITNNHVVTGAAFLHVWVDGELKPRNAKILGVSECSDLAVIDIAGERYHYLEWYSDQINVGLEIYAAGFPLIGFNSPESALAAALTREFTLTRGIISKAHANGETEWASVDNVIEHDAIVNRGNSGGPLVTKTGKVVGINYSSNPEVRQSFAIARDEALKVINELRNGKDIDSIGINGKASDNILDFSGIWVSSVKSGSQADQIGIRGGDIITMMEGLNLAENGTMSEYCDILRSHEVGDPLSIQILRITTKGTPFEGQLNGRKLEISE